MSNRSDYQGPNFETLQIENIHWEEYMKSHFKGLDSIRDAFYRILRSGIHGICFSIYKDGQHPGVVIAADQVKERLHVLKPYVSSVRSFSCIEGNENVPILAKEMGMKTLVGAWIGDDEEKNNLEIEMLIDLCHNGYVDVAAVGNEVLYRQEMSEQDLIGLINHVKNNIPEHIPVGYVDAYYEFTLKPDLAEACDVILCNCYPFWEGTPFEYSLAHMKSMYYQAKEAGRGKKVIITETGWPSHGDSFKSSLPSAENAMKYFIQTQLWAHEEGIESYYFSSFDESWKTGDEGDVGAYWGIWDKKEEFKY